MKIFFRIVKDLKKFYKQMIIGLIGLFAVTATNLVSPQIIRRLIGLISNKDNELVVKSIRYAVILLIVYVIKVISQYLMSYYSHLAAWNYVSDLRIRVYDHFQNLSIGYFHDKQTGQLMSITENDTRDMEELIAHVIPDLIVSIITFIGVLIIIFTINPTLALFTLLTTPFSILLVRKFATKVLPIFKKARQIYAEFTALLHDDLNGVKEIQTFNQQEREYDRVKKLSEEHVGMNLKALRLSAIFHPAVGFVTNLGTVLVVGMGGVLASKGRVPVEDIVAFMLYLGAFYEPINTLSRINEGLQNALACAARIFDVLDTKSEVKEAENPIDLGRVNGEIELKNVCFSYVDGIDVLKDINLKVNPGETVALVGPTGVGKTTIASLITRFYDPKEGIVTIDGTDIKNVSFKSLRDNISTVLQDVYLFNGTVADNIAYGMENASEDDIINAAKNANADEFISELPEGYDTIIGERGVKLSGGQKQRLSIARALLRNAPIIILDEATASVDMNTEKLIHDAIANVIKNRTTIIIAHRLASIKNSDKIVVLEDGRIVQTGTHTELTEQEGLYRDLCNVSFG